MSINLPASIADLLGTTRRIISLRFSRDVASLAGGNLIAQIVTLAAAPIITRLYGPEEFGTLGVFLAITGTLTAVAALAYSHAIVLPREDKESVALVKLAIGASLVFAVIVAGGIALWQEPLLRLFGAKEIQKYLLLIPVFIVITTWYQVSTQWLIRKKEFFVQGKIAVINAVALNGAKIGFGIVSSTALALIILATAGNFLHGALLTIEAKKRGFLASQSGADPGVKVLTVAREYSDFPVYRAPQLLLNEFSRNLPVIVIAFMFSPAVAGFYALSHRMLILPSDIIGKAVASVFFSRFAEAIHEREQIITMLTKTTLILAAIGALPFGLVIALGPDLFSFAFGSQWDPAGEYARWMTVFLFASFVARPSSQSLLVQRRQRYLLLWNIAFVVTTLIVLALGSYTFGNALATVAAYSVTTAFFYVLLIIEGFRCANAHSKSGT